MLKSPKSPVTISAARAYAALLHRAVTHHEARATMGKLAAVEGVRGYTWWDAMEVGQVIALVRLG